MQIVRSLALLFTVLARAARKAQHQSQTNRLSHASAHGTPLNRMILFEFFDGNLSRIPAGGWIRHFVASMVVNCVSILKSYEVA
jgi:hypothetical protein